MARMRKRKRPPKSSLSQYNQPARQSDSDRHRQTDPCSHIVLCETWSYMNQTNRHLARSIRPEPTPTTIKSVSTTQIKYCLNGGVGVCVVCSRDGRHRRNPCSSTRQQGVKVWGSCSGHPPVRLFPVSRWTAVLPVLGGGHPPRHRRRASLFVSIVFT